MKLKDLLTEHPYYCSTSNYLSREADCEWESWHDFFDEWGALNLDFNLVFRWDLEAQRDEDTDKVMKGLYTLKIYFILQRKGHFIPHVISNVTRKDFPAIREYLKQHWETLQEIWAPFS